MGKLMWDWRNISSDPIDLSEQPYFKLFLDPPI